MQNQRPNPSPEVQTLLDQARTADLAGKRDEAARLSQQALALAQQRADRPGEANALFSWGRATTFTAPSEARDHLECALPLFRELMDRYGEASCLLSLGNVHQIQGAPDPALERYSAARKLFEEVDARKELATTLSNTGALFVRTGQPRRALEYLLPARDASEKAGDQPGVLRALGNIGAAHRNAQDMPRAKETLEQALGLAQSLGSKQDEGIIWLNLGLTMQQLQGPLEAIACFNRSLPLLEATGDRRAMGATLASRAAAADQAGDLLASARDLQRALDIFRQIGDQNGSGRVLHSLGLLSEQLGERDEARRRYEEGFALSKAAGDIHSQMLLLGALGEMAGQAGDRLAQQRHFRAALGLDGADRLPVPRTWTLLSLSRSLTRAGSFTEAIEPAQEARNLSHATQDARGEGRAQIALGAAYQGLGRTGEARGCYERALTLCGSVNDVTGEAQAAALLGSLEEDAGQRTAAARHYRHALELHEGLRTSLGNLDEAKVGYLETQIDIYRRYIRFLLRNRQEADAFAAAQKAKARALIDRMAAGQGVPVPPRTVSDRAQEERLTHQGRELVLARQALQNEQAELARRQPRDLSRESALAQQASVLQQRLQRLDRELRAYQERLYLRDPHLADRRAARTVTLEEAAGILPPGTALLEYVVLPDEIVLFVVTRETNRPGLCAFRQPGAAALSGEIDALRVACAGRPGTAARRPFQDTARRLYRRLIAPAEAILSRQERLILCPDGILWGVPFAVLVHPERGFLWDRFTLSFAYSATGHRAALAAPRRKPPRTMLALANPHSGPSPAPTRPGRALGPLPHAQREAETIAALFAGSDIRSGSAAQEALVKKTADQYRYLHFATHALFQDSAPMLSGIVLADPPKDSPEDGILSVQDLVDMKLNAELLTLSACETARGDQRPGEGIIGLTWAAFVAGVPSQIVSQWPVDDASTARLMTHFYRGLRAGASKDQALRTAARDLRRDRRFAHPFYWAPFVLIGSGR